MKNINRMFIFDIKNSRKMLNALLCVSAMALLNGCNSEISDKTENMEMTLKDDIEEKTISANEEDIIRLNDIENWVVGNKDGLSSEEETKKNEISESVYIEDTDTDESRNEIENSEIHEDMNSVNIVNTENQETETVNDSIQNENTEITESDEVNSNDEDIRNEMPEEPFQYNVGNSEMLFDTEEEAISWAEAYWDEHFREIYGYGVWSTGNKFTIHFKYYEK